MDDELAQLLDKGMAQMPLSLSSSEEELLNHKQQLLMLVQMLEKWNKAFNLTAIREPREMVIRHILDSLSIAPYLVGKRLLDVGSGAGLPGLPLAIIFPEKQFTLLDSNGKKTRFITQARSELGLANVDVVQSRVEKYTSSEPYSSITARAFSSLAVIINSTRHLLAEKGRLLLMKGVFPAEELSQIPAGFMLHEAVTLNVPMLEAERHLIILKQHQP
jgi:16S rRNA (guanine527-N7)-methyltransferase